VKIGYFLSCEEYAPHELLEQAVLAADAGFEGLWISDHYHPWNDEQGQSPFVWSMIGAISQVCDLPVTTAVTCPIMRMGPTLVAQAAATANVLLDGRFRLGVGTGEALNEHIHGEAWPPERVRLGMLEEAVDVIRALWQGQAVQHHGPHYTVENARIYTRTEQPPEIYVSAFGPTAAEVAARCGDGLITTSVNEEIDKLFRDRGKPLTGGFKVAWAQTEDEGAEHAYRLWPNSGLPGELSQVLPSPKHFEQATQLVTKDMVEEGTVCGPDVDRHIGQFDQWIEARYAEVYVANMGPNYKDMISTYGEQVLPAVRAKLS
jgi:G6PDH family F420-dependent oxidoreductase